jgi:TolB-like protein/Flp pilus assembly protein TadD
VKSLRDDLQASLGTTYALERELGGGGMSRVWLATETALGRQVVVKVIAPELAEGLSAERFSREVRLAARLQQANIVPVLSTGTAAGLPYYTMPYVRGESLRARMAGGAPWSLTERVSILRDVARALAYAHGEGVVHRDIKPENVLLSHGAAVVTDFGIAKALTASRTQDGGTGAALTQAGGSIGTPAYMAPEQAVGDALDHRTDLYAWGVMAYELLTGRHPFARHTSPQTLITAHLTETPAALDTTDGVPAAVAALVMRCLEKNPGQRPASAAEVLAALDQVATSGAAAAAGRLGGSAHPRTRRVALGAGAILLASAGLWLAFGRGTSAPSGAAEKSLAVLPFEPVGGDTANAYFAEGIGDELTTALSRLPGLRVAGRSSAIRFRGKGASAKEVGSALGVGSVLDGTVRRSGGRVRVSAQLTSASDGLVMWSESYEREAKDVFALQDDIAQAIVSALQVRLATSSAQSVSTARTTDPETYDLYLRGLYLYRRRGAGLLRAAELFEQAIARDSLFARAHAALATVLLTQPYYLPARIGDVLPRARAVAERAVTLDPGLSEAHQALSIAHFHAFEWAASEREIRQAIALDPQSAEARYRLGFILISMGRTAEAIPEFERAKAIDPLYSIVAAYLGYAYAVEGRPEAGIAEGRRAVELDSTLLASLTMLTITYHAAGRPAEALDVARRVMTQTDDPRRWGYVGFSLASAGDSQYSRARISQLEAMPPNSPRRNAGLALLYLALGDTARALTAMERAAAGDGDLLFAMPPNDAIYDPVRRSPRFASVLRRFHLDLARLTAPRGGRPQ